MNFYIIFMEKKIKNDSNRNSAEKVLALQTADTDSIMITKCKTRSKP